MHHDEQSFFFAEILTMKVYFYPINQLSQQEWNSCHRYTDFLTSCFVFLSNGINSNSCVMAAHQAHFVISTYEWTFINRINWIHVTIIFQVHWSAITIHYIGIVPLQFYNSPKYAITYFFDMFLKLMDQNTPRSSSSHPLSPASLSMAVPRRCPRGLWCGSLRY